jgi:hypothetical protein
VKYAPRGLGVAGKRLWTAVMDEFNLDGSAIEKLVQACQTTDLLHDLQAKVADTPAIIESPSGPRIHPLLVELRQQRLVLTKLIGALGLPAEFDDEDRDDAGE